MRRRIRRRFGHVDRSSLNADIVAWLGYVYGLGNLALGSVLLFGGPYRLSAPSFRNIIALAPGPGWGCAFLLTGAVALWGQWRDRMMPAFLGHVAAAVMCCYWVAGFLNVIVGNPFLSWTPVVAYGVMAAGHSVLGVASRAKPRH